MGLIKTNGSAFKSVLCDSCKYSITIKRSSENLNISVDQMLNTYNELLTKLNMLNIKDIKLVEDNTSEFLYEKKKYYRAYRMISFNSEADVSFNNKLLKELSSLDVEINSEYYCLKEKDFHDELIKEALLDSRHKAEVICTVSNQKIIGLEEVELSDNSMYTREANLCTRNDISNKEIQISEQLTASWKIE